ncbi:MFS transporter [Sulfurimonas microaerophilic]|uniref:MFS transporter n=1 Tax=Sulfurimonas microaerophilic TaxID=3058392 RepID=UPI0027144B9B|nr:MFS transporter [Sulfurimonas sp. hsl 1-7]
MNKKEKIFAVTGMINYIIVVFLNAFTDLGHKIIIQNTIFKMYDGSTQIMLTAIVNALILFPFILVFSPAGFLADRFAKSKVMQHSALFGLVLTLLITFTYYKGWFFFAFALTFLLALQSAIYSPAKYGYIKELVGEKLISSGNAAVQATTTVAILGGIIIYSIFFESLYSESLTTKEEILQAIAPLGWLLVLGMTVEWVLTLKMPNTQAQSSKRTFVLKRYIKGVYLHKNLKAISRKQEILDAILALSFFWSISQVVLAIFGEYAKTEIGITNTVFVQGVMALAGIGIVAGSIIAAKLSKNHINLGITGIGAIFLTAIVFLVPFVHSMWIIAIMFTSFGVFSAFLLVPLNARIQYLASNVHLGMILAASNFVQNIFMFSFLVITTFFAYFGMNAEVLFYMMGFVGIYLIYKLFKNYFAEIFWSVVGAFISLRYKVVYEGLENLSDNKAILLLGNHVSWLDWAILQFPFRRKINYMMDKDIYSIKWLQPLLKKGEVIPLSSRAFKDAFKEASRRLKAKRVVAIFPEGAIARNTDITNFQKGFELIDGGYDGYVVPFFIDGMFGSKFAKNKKPNQHNGFFSRRTVKVIFGAPLSKNIKANEVEEKIKQMKEEHGIK